MSKWVTWYFCTMNKLKLIWDFRSPVAANIADHHVKHLKEYVLAKGIDCDIIEVEHLSEMYSIAYMVVHEADMKPIRDALKPHRGQYYEEP